MSRNILNGLTMLIGLCGCILILASMFEEGDKEFQGLVLGWLMLIYSAVCYEARK